MEGTMKHLIYAVVAVVALVLSAGAFACEGQHSAAADSTIVVAQQQVTPAAQATVSQDNGATSEQSKPSVKQ
jgi:hypothetical protein